MSDDDAVALRSRSHNSISVDDDALLTSLRPGHLNSSARRRRGLFGRHIKQESACAGTTMSRRPSSIVGLRYQSTTPPLLGVPAYVRYA